MKIRIFVSSAQKELADERSALQTLLTTDPYLSQHCEPILFEQCPAPLVPKDKPYITLLQNSQVYVGIIWKKYGQKVDGEPPTHGFSV